MKYSGPLGKNAIIPYSSAPDGFPRYWIYLSALGITLPTSSATITSSGQELAVILDSGSTLSYLPTAVVTSLLGYFTGVISRGSGLYSVPCSYLTAVGSIDFTFGNTYIHVPFSQFIWFNVYLPLCQNLSKMRLLMLTSFKGVTCYFGAIATSSVDVILGGSLFCIQHN